MVAPPPAAATGRRGAALKRGAGATDAAPRPPAGGIPALPIETQSTGYQQAVARVREIAASIAPPATAPAATTSFGDTLSSAMGGSTTPGTQSASSYVPSSVGGTLPIGIGAVASAPAGARGQQIAALASAELGVAEQPPGSNDAPRIAEYRTATAGAAAGQPWCAYFTSWVAARAGVPIGPDGQGLGYVPTVKQWAEQTGRYIPAGTGSPQVGDLVVFDRGGDGVLDHIGVVTGASPDGSIQTVEGNSSNAVSARSYGPGGYAGLVRLVAPGS